MARFVREYNTNAAFNVDKMSSVYVFLDTAPNPDVYRINCTTLGNNGVFVDITLNGAWETEAEALAVLRQVFEIVDPPDYDS